MRVPALDEQVAEEGTKRLSEAGLVEQIEHVRPGPWPDGYAPREGREDTPCTKAIRSVLVGEGAASPRSSAVALLCRPGQMTEGRWSWPGLIPIHGSEGALT